MARNLLLQGAQRRRVADALVDRLVGELRVSLSHLEADDRSYPSIPPGLDAALETLSERDREIVTLTAWEELTPREIATIMGMSSNAVRIRLHRARAHLKTHLAPERTGSGHALSLAEHGDP